MASYWSRIYFSVFPRCLLYLVSGFGFCSTVHTHYNFTQLSIFDCWHPHLKVSYLRKNNNYREIYELSVFTFKSYQSNCHHKAVFSPWNSSLISQRILQSSIPAAFCGSLSSHTTTISLFRWVIKNFVEYAYMPFGRGLEWVTCIGSRTQIKDLATNSLSYQL